MRSLSDILYIILLRKWWIILPAMCAPVLAVAWLMFVEPQYTSHAKLWAKEHNEQSNLLKVQRSGSQEETFARVQSELIMSSRVLGIAVDRLELNTPPPSASLWSRKFGQPERKPVTDIEEAHREAIKALAGNTGVEVVNPEILVVSVKANTPELAQKAVETIVEVYREQYLQILNEEIDTYEAFLTSRSGDFKAGMEKAERELKAWETDHTKQSTDDSKVHIPGILNSHNAADYTDLASALGVELGDISPVPSVLKRQAELEMEQNRLSLRLQPDHPDLLRLADEVELNRRVLDKYLSQLSGQASIAIDHMRLAWELKIARQRYADLLAEYDQLIVSRGTKLRQAGSITYLDAPTFNSAPIYPKKKLTIMAAAVLGAFAGAALAYLIHLADPTFRLAAELAEVAEVPVLSELPPAD